MKSISIEAIRKAYAAALENEDETGVYYSYYGIRFEDKARQVGDICECSKDNRDRTDERDFPEYGTPEYDEMPELEGSCAWDAASIDYAIRPSRRGGNAVDAFCEHVYLIAGNRACEGGGDDYEVCIEDAVVIAIID